MGEGLLAQWIREVDNLVEGVVLGCFIYETSIVSILSQGA